MGLPHAERRQIENEMIFRRINEKVGSDLHDLDAKHMQDGHFDLVSDKNMLLHFTCECSDEKCTARIPMLLTEYQTIHTDRDTFVVLPHHEVDPIEKIVKKTPGYNVVKKNHSTPEPGDVLNVTSIRKKR